MFLAESKLKRMFLAGALATFLATLAGAFAGLSCALLCLITGTILNALFFCYTRQRYKEIGRMNEYLDRVICGDYSLELSANREGELSRLQNNLYKVIVILRSQNEQLNKDRVFLADSLADISHQLKTPLTTLCMMTDMLKDEELGEKKRFLKIMETQTEKMNWMVRNLLKLSRLDTGTIEFKSVEISIEEVLTDSLKPFVVLMELKNITLERQGEDFSFWGDKSWSVEAFGNIIKNALEHMEEGGRLSVITRENLLYGEVIIEDTGCGMAPEDLEHIFERFYRGKNSGSDSVGIGLAMAKTIFEREKGKIIAESREGEGSRFIVHFYKSII